MKNKSSYICGSTLLSDPDTTIFTHLLSALLELFWGIYKHYDYIYIYVCVCVCVCIYTYTYVW